MTTPARQQSPAQVVVPSRRGCWRPIRNTLLLGVLLLAGAVLWGWMLGEAEQRAARLHTQVMQPYFLAVTEGRLHDAWSQFTTARYRERFPFPEFQRAQQDRRWLPPSRIEAPGKLAARLIAGGARVKYYNLTQVDTGDPPIVFYDILETAQGARIDASYRMIWHTYTSKEGRRSADEDRLEEAW